MASVETASITNRRQPMNEVANAARTTRPIDPQRSEPQILAIGGAVLLGLSGVFLWKELRLPIETLAIGLAGIVALAVAGLSRASFKVVGPVLLLAGTGVVGLWYAATREPVLLVALSTLMVASIAAIALEARRERLTSDRDRWHRLLSWHGAALTGLATSFAFYFHIFDASDLSLQGFVARRVVLTLAWLFIGTALVLSGRKQKLPEVRDAGFLVLATAVGKMLIYDVSHVDGALRVGALAIAGVTLLAAAEVARRLNLARA